jgi:hypothetical protein
LTVGRTRNCTIQSTFSSSVDSNLRIGREFPHWKITGQTGGIFPEIILHRSNMLPPPIPALDW